MEGYALKTKESSCRIKYDGKGSHMISASLHFSGSAKWEVFKLILTQVKFSEEIFSVEVASKSITK
jgi:hypothetical protein